MESYVEVSFMHNSLICACSLTCAIMLSKKPMSRQHFLKIILMTTLLPSFLFIEGSDMWIGVNEIMMFMLFFQHRSHTYLLFASFRFFFHLIYYLLFQGTICHLQFFIFDEYGVLCADLIVLIGYLALLLKGRYEWSQKDFLYPFELDHHQYLGYLDSGNLATYDSLPIIFVKESIYTALPNKPLYFWIEHVNGQEEVCGVRSEVILNHKKIKVICCPLSNDYPYDALLNMKGIL